MVDLPWGLLLIFFVLGTATFTLSTISGGGGAMMQIPVVNFLIGAGAAGAVRVVPVLPRAPARRVLTLIYDKSLGMMRAVERLVP